MKEKIYLTIKVRPLIKATVVVYTTIALIDAVVGVAIPRLRKLDDNLQTKLERDKQKESEED